MLFTGGFLARAGLAGLAFLMISGAAAMVAAASPPGSSPASASTPAAVTAAPAVAAAAPASGTSSGGSTASGPTNASVLFKMSRPTVFVLAYASDPVTSSFLAYEVTSNLTKTMALDQTNPTTTTRSIWLLPEPAWQLSDFAIQCQNDPEATLGAMVVYDVENDAGSYNYFIFSETYSQLHAKALFVDCEAYRPKFVSAFPSAITSLAQSTTYNGTPTLPSPAPACSGNCTTPTPVGSPVAAKTVALTEAYPTTHPPAAPSPNPTQVMTTTTDGIPAQTIETQTTTVIPTMKVQWLSFDELRNPHSSANQYGIPLFSFAALGAYLASRTYSQSTTISQEVPATPGTSTSAGNVTTSTTRSGNNSTLPFGIALVGNSLASLSSITIGGANQTRVLKRAASGVASQLRAQIKSTCASSNSAPGSSPTPAPTPDGRNFCSLFQASAL